MKKLLKHRKSSLVIGAIAILLLALLAASLESMEFLKGQPFSYLEDAEESASPSGMPNLSWVYFVVIGIYMAIMVLTLYYAPRKKRRKIILALLGIALGLLGIMWWMTLVKNEPQEYEPATTVLHESLPSTAVSPPEEEQGEAEVFIQPTISPWISIGISFGVMLVATVVIWFVLKNQFKHKIPLEELAEIAEKTISDINSGKDYGDSVINCYASMMNVLNKKRNIFKRGDLTPTEFIAVLERTTLPHNSVRRLTALFEKVRYGGKNTTQVERVEAIGFLNDIVSAIQDE